jgi:isovaleryl-CoA dehydrogenase
VGNDLATLLAATREVAVSRIAREAARVDRERAFPTAGLRTLAEVGALRVAVPRSHGGAGGGLGALVDACEAVGAACASTGMVFLMHEVTAVAIARGGGPRAATVVPALAAGTAIGTLAFSEPGTGAHFYNPKLRAERRNGSVRLSGRKSFVTSGGHADLYLVLVEGAEPGTADAYLVSRDDPGVRFDGSWRGLGMAGNSSIALELDGVELPEDARVGEPGSAGALLFEVVAPFFLAGLAAVNVGIAGAAARAATAHVVSRRYPDGSSLAEVQHLQHLLAEMDLRIRQARLLVREAAALADAGDPGALVPVMEAKVAATDAAAAVTQAALEATGGKGYTPALPVERHLRDARAGAVMAPTNAVLRTWIGKALAGLPVP